jgi:hypothetical protein
LRPSRRARAFASAARERQAARRCGAPRAAPQQSHCAAHLLQHHHIARAAGLAVAESHYVSTSPRLHDGSASRRAGLARHADVGAEASRLHDGFGLAFDGTVAGAGAAARCLACTSDDSTLGDAPQAEAEALVEEAARRSRARVYRVTSSALKTFSGVCGAAAQPSETATCGRRGVGLSCSATPACAAALSTQR